MITGDNKTLRSPNQSSYTRHAFQRPVFRIRNCLLPFKRMGPNSQKQTPTAVESSIGQETGVECPAAETLWPTAEMT
jgi:hypothetical protein